MKAMKSMKAKTAMKAMKAVKRPSAKQAMQPAAVEKDRVAPMVPSIDEDHVEVAQMDANSGEVFCLHSYAASLCNRLDISEMEKPGCDGVRMVAVGICVTVMDDKTKDDDDGKKDDDQNDDGKKDDDQKKDDDTQGRDSHDTSGNSDSSDVSSSHWNQRSGGLCS
eukprot:s3249_g12.t1